MQEALHMQAVLYRDYVNNFISFDRWACYHGFYDFDDARIYLNAGKSAHEAGF